MPTNRTYLILAIYTLFLVLVPFIHPNYYIFLTNLVGTTVSLVSLFLMYTFLGSAPEAQQTITNSLHMHLSVVMALYLGKNFILSFFFNLLPGSTKVIFESNPILMCSLLSDRQFVMPIILAFVFIAMSKLYMTIYPLHFSGLNHRLLGNLSIATMILLPALDSGVRLVIHNSLCNAIYLETILRGSYGLNISPDIGIRMKFSWFIAVGVSG